MPLPPPPPRAPIPSGGALAPARGVEPALPVRVAELLRLLQFEG